VAKRFKTKIIASTKIAESSVTIDKVSVVIDTGLAREATYDPVRRITSIETDFISQSQAMQRRGRAGRTSTGICYRLYSEEEFNQFDADKAPEIQKTNAEQVILKILGLGI
jgi:HrpA-like RNA helicase